MKITFSHLEKGKIFNADFFDMKKNNQIDFSDDGIAIIYGPNGIGKTSLVKILSGEENTICTYAIDDIHFDPNNQNFFVIEDQNGRNIISGETEDFILGANIRREYELKIALQSEFTKTFEILIQELKKTYGISKKHHVFEKFINNEQLQFFISDLANFQSKGKNIDHKLFIETINSLQIENINDYDESVFTYFVNDFLGDNLIDKVLNLHEENISQETNIQKIEETDEAIKILTKYSYLHDCLICDNKIDPEKLKNEKKDLREKVIKSLSPNTLVIIESIINIIADKSDPLLIKEKLIESIKYGDFSSVSLLQKELSTLILIYQSRINNLFANCLTDTNILNNYKEYESIVQEKPEFSDEDILFIQRFVDEHLHKKIDLKRDPENNISILLENKPFLGSTRESLHLSNGEQNFLSLAFELLKAKKSENKIVLIDDPISSFDSIYKNKIAYAILKFLEGKKQIILTHNTDLIQLLEHQKNKCFNLYLLHNTDSEENGFIPINKAEQEILLYINKLLDLLRNDIYKNVVDEQLFIISIIPFMRGYCMLVGEKESKNQLSKIMHGYSKDKVDITEIYEILFKNNHFSKNIEFSPDDLLNLDLDNIEILKNDIFPLLNKTLKHCITYLYLRMYVEKSLVEKYKINTNQCETLSKIINKAFNADDENNRQKRVFLLSRKTLLNEFNHFEMDMNIFQPAIDITDTALAIEKRDILEFIHLL